MAGKPTRYQNDVGNMRAQAGTLAAAAARAPSTRISREWDIGLTRLCGLGRAGRVMASAR
ncbi:MAG TPA: hypothetical protein VNF47_19610 [Streptosporangiaceae bacterium]|nr:hypothetical protein [Streptosporangiaceae bacterium]